MRLSWILLAPLAACASDRAPTGATGATSATGELTRRIAAENQPRFGEQMPVSTSIIVVHGKLSSSCQILQSDTYFPYDSSKLSEAAKASLDRIVGCLTSRGMRSATIHIVGYGDPGGGDRYDDELGESRAQSVARHLIERGVSPDRIETESGGEIEEVDEAGWPYARRVELSLKG